MPMIFLLLIMTIPLTGCVGAAVVGASAAAGGIIIADQRSPGTLVEDQNISARIERNLKKNELLKSQGRVSITTYNGTVLLVGQVPTEQLREQAVTLAQQTPDVKRVHNEITIGKPILGWEQSRDAWLTTKVKTALFGTKNLPSARIRVLTENEVVYLLGIVSSQEAELATNAARQISGVKTVVRLFEIRN